MNRSSIEEWSGSKNMRARSSRKAVCASSNDTSCLRSALALVPDEAQAHAYIVRTTPREATAWEWRFERGRGLRRGAQACPALSAGSLGGRDRHEVGSEPVLSAAARLPEEDVARAAERRHRSGSDGRAVEEQLEGRPCEPQL